MRRREGADGSSEVVSEQARRIPASCSSEPRVAGSTLGEVDRSADKDVEWWVWTRREGGARRKSELTYRPVPAFGVLLVEKAAHRAVR